MDSNLNVGILVHKLEKLGRRVRLNCIDQNEPFQDTRDSMLGLSA